MKLKEYLKNRFKHRSKLSQVIDTLLVALLIIMLVPSLRRDYGSYLVRVFMTTPSLSDTIEIPLTKNDLNFMMLTPENTKVTLQEMLDKPIFFTWWATWCHHCVAEASQLEKLHRKMGDRIHVLILVNEPKNHIKDFLSKKNIQLPIYFALQGKTETLSAKSLPTTFVINKNGTVVYKKSGAKNWNSEKFLQFLQQIE